jgi:hypothetical protein
VNVNVYITKADEEKLKALGHDPKVWVRGLVKHALSKVGSSVGPL